MGMGRDDQYILSGFQLLLGTSVSIRIACEQGRAAIEGMQ